MFGSFFRFSMSFDRLMIGDDDASERSWVIAGVTEQKQANVGLVRLPGDLSLTRALVKYA